MHVLVRFPGHLSIALALCLPNNGQCEVVDCLPCVQPRNFNPSTMQMYQKGPRSDLDLILMHNQNSLISFSRRQRKRGEIDPTDVDAKMWRQCLILQLDSLARLAGQYLDTKCQTLPRSEKNEQEICSLENDWSVQHNKGKFSTFRRCQDLLRKAFQKTEELGKVIVLQRVILLSFASFVACSLCPSPIVSLSPTPWRQRHSPRWIRL